MKARQIPVLAASIVLLGTAVVTTYVAARLAKRFLRALNHWAEQASQQ